MRMPLRRNGSPPRRAEDLKQGSKLIEAVGALWGPVACSEHADTPEGAGPGFQPGCEDCVATAEATLDHLWRALPR